MTFTPKIIGFCGYPGSGKDEAASILVKHGWQRIAFADPLRAMALAIDPLLEWTSMQFTRRLSEMVAEYGWDCMKKNPEVRRLLQRIGAEAVRDIIGPDTWVQVAERSMEVGRHVVFTDVRFANEAALISSRGGLLCRIWRDSATEKFGKSEHASEQYPFSWDCEIQNSGTAEELHNKVLELAGLSF